VDVKPGYKQTEVGVIPEEWEAKPFGKLAHIERGKFSARPRNDPKYYGGDIPFIQTGDVTNSNGKITTYTQTLNLAGLRVSKLFPRGTLFFTIAANIGDVGFTDFDAACPDSLVAITPAEGTDKNWLAYELAKRKSLFEAIATHNAQLNINLEKLRPYLLPRPPPPEQRAIATALGDVDELLGGLDRLIAKKRDIKQAAMQQLLTGQTRLPGFRGEWVPLNMADDSTLKARIGWQGLTTAEYKKAGDYFLVTGTDFLGGRITWSSCSFVAAERYTQDPNIQLRPRDILLTKDGTIGKVAFVGDLPGPATLNSGVFVIRPRDEAYDPQYFYFVLSSRICDEFLAKLQAGSTISHLYQKDFVSFTFLAPRALSEQTAIAGVLSAMDAELAALEQRRDKTRALKQGMMQELLTGRSRLI
jgi:type I restriction enzyme S subunit